jgi:SpoVK/Ycf46/Vps4 family AAA+-type ATPase
VNKPLYLDEYQDIIIDKTKLSTLKENQSIMTKLRNKKLQKIIREIDSAKFKKKSLEKMMNDKDFKDFVDEILVSLGYLKDEVFNY